MNCLCVDCKCSRSFELEEHAKASTESILSDNKSDKNESSEIVPIEIEFTFKEDG